jgi:hypothetical protein
LDEIGADVVLFNGKVVTVDEDDSIFEAIAIKDGRILKAGTNEEIQSLASSRARQIDLKGRTVLPGFIDSHEHCIR